MGYVKKQIDLDADRMELKVLFTELAFQLQRASEAELTAFIEERTKPGPLRILCQTAVQASLDDIGFRRLFAENKRAVPYWTQIERAVMGLYNRQGPEQIKNVF